MAMLIEGLISGEIDENWSVSCPGYFTVGNRTFRCWRKGGHGNVGCIHAIEASCDVFFYKLGMKLGPDGIHRALTRFHFGSPTGIDQTSEASGLAPSTDYYNRRYGERGWTKGYIPSISIGQGEMLVTPLQLCCFAAAIADGNYWKQPYLVDHIVNPTTGIVMRPEQGLRQALNVPPEIMAIAREGMRRVVWGDFGTARAQRSTIASIAGKTGTAQNSHGDDHAWFIGYAPIDSPRYAACALVEFGEHGSSAAAPIVRRMLDFLIAAEQPPTEDVAHLPAPKVTE
jgi:penicillin-binding protein 2